MERLIADANRVKEANGEMADLSIDSFADITEAIHIIQDEMGITGTTFEEAEDTISGSMNSAKAAFDNFINGSGDINTFVETLTTALGNVGKAVGELAPSIMEGIGSLVQQLIPQIPSAINTMLPIILDSTVNIINSLTQALPAFLTMIQDNSQIFIDGALTIIETIINVLLENLPQFLEMGMELILQLILGIAEKAPDLVPQIVNAIIAMMKVFNEHFDDFLMAGVKLILGLIQGLIKSIPDIIKNLPTILMAILNFFTAQKLISAGITLLKGLGTGLIDGIPELIKNIPKIISNMVTTFKNNGLGAFKDIGLNLVQGLWNGINNAKSWVLDKIKGFGKSILNGLKSFFGIKSPSRVMRDQVGKYLAEGVGVGFEDAIDDVYKNMQKVVDIETEKMSANVQTSGVYQIAMNGTPNFELLDRSTNQTQLIVNGKILAEVVNTENRNREVAKA